MKITINNENFIIYVNKKLINYDINDKNSIEKYIKDLILKIRKIYKIKIAGYYTVKVYQNIKYGLIFDIKKEDELYFFPDLIDLKVSIEYNSKILLESDDYFIFNSNKVYIKDNKYYVNIKDLEETEINRLSEFCTIKYS